MLNIILALQVCCSYVKIKKFKEQARNNRVPVCPGITKTGRVG
jgi:hypothetical protein